MVLLVRNKVEDADHWKRIFDKQGEVAGNSGMKVLHVWRSADEADQVWFLLDVEDRAKAEAYMATPEAAAVGVESRVIDGEVRFLEAFDS